MLKYSCDLYTSAHTKTIKEKKEKKRFRISEKKINEFDIVPIKQTHNVGKTSFLLLRYYNVVLTFCVIW